MDLKSGLVRSSSSLLSLLWFQSSSFNGECLCESLDGESRGDEVRSVGASRRCIVMFCLVDTVMSLFHSSSTTRYDMFGYDTAVLLAVVRQFDTLYARSCLMHSLTQRLRSSGTFCLFLFFLFFCRSSVCHYGCDFFFADQGNEENLVAHNFSAVCSH